MEDNKLNLISKELEFEKPKFHYEPTETFTEEVPVYDEIGNQTGTETRVTGRIVKKIWTDEGEAEKERISLRIMALKSELGKIKEDIEQEVFGLIREDYAAKKARAAEIINELRLLEGKEPRMVKE